MQCQTRERQSERLIHRLAGKIQRTDVLKEGVFIELTEQLIDTKPRNYITSDNVKVVADCVIRWRIVDPIKAVYEVDNFYRSLTETILNSMRGEIGSRSLDSAIKSRH